MTFLVLFFYLLVLYVWYRHHGITREVHDAGANVRKPRDRAPNMAELATLKKMSTHQLI